MSHDLGIDRSGNGHSWTVNNMAFADQVVDSPTNNFATIDPLSSGAGVFSEGNLKYVSTSDTGVGTFGISSGKAYVEIYVSSASNHYVGVCDISRGISPTRGGDWSSHGGIAYKFNGDQYSLPVGGSSSVVSYGGASYTDGDIIGIAFDVDADTITFYKNGVSQGNTANGLSHISSNGVYSIMLYGTATFVANFGQDSSFAGNKTAQGNQDGNDIGDFYYTPPTGFLALCTSNLPDVAVTPSKNFNTVLWTGTGSTNGDTQSITGVGFQPDFFWSKSRSMVQSHALLDVIRGTDSFLIANSTSAESDKLEFDTFDTDGFSVRYNEQYQYLNNNNENYVAWNWKANGSGSSNTDGSITSTVSANVDAGFSIVSYTGTGSAGTVGHGLSQAPELVIVKQRTTAGNHWVTWHGSVCSGSQFLYLDNTGTINTHSPIWNGTVPSSTVFSVATDEQTNKSTDSLIAYCFHSVDGYSKVGSYTGNGNADGTFVYTGFRPAFILHRKTNGSANWIMTDAKRNTSNPVGKYLMSNSSNAEADGTSFFDYTSNGFKLRTSGGGQNGSGDTHIFIAFAETPFKYANAG